MANDRRRTINQIFGQFIMKGYNGSISKKLLTETNGELKVSNYGIAGSTVTAFKVETTGEQDIVLHGKDSGGNIDPLRTNANQELIVDISGTVLARTPLEAYAVPSVEADLWAPGGANTTYYDIELEMVNVDGSNDATASIGVDYGDDGGGTPNRYFVYSVPVRAGEAGVRRGPFRIWADDAITGVANAANDVQLHIYILDQGTVG